MLISKRYRLRMKHYQTQRKKILLESWNSISAPKRATSMLKYIPVPSSKWMHEATLTRIMLLKNSNIPDTIKTMLFSLAPAKVLISDGNYNGL